jgi:hypothetical protein
MSDVYSEGLNGGDRKGGQTGRQEEKVPLVKKRVGGLKGAQTRWGAPKGKGRRGNLNPLGGFKGRKRSEGAEGPVRAGVVPNGSLNSSLTA